MITTRRRNLLVAITAIALGCGPGGGDDGGGGGSRTVTRYAVDVAGATGNVGLSRYPFWTLSDDLYVTLGQDNAAGMLLTGVDANAGTVRFVRRLEVQGLTALGPDGAGGVIAVGRDPGMRAMRFDATGQLLWSHHYDDVGTPIGTLTGLQGVFSHEAASNVHDGKLALVILGNVVVVDVATGTPMWRRVIPGGGTQQFRVVASDEGLWMIGAVTEGMAVVRIAWDGTLVDARVAQTVPAGFSFGQPVPHDGGYLVSYLFKTGGTRSISYGLLSLAMDGTKRDHWSYRISGDRSVSPTGGVLINPALESEPFVVQPMSGGRFWLNIAAATYTGSGSYERTDLGFPISATGGVLDTSPAWDESRLVLFDDARYVAVRENGVMTIGAWSTACAAEGVDVHQLEHTLDVQPPLDLLPTTMTLAAPTITATAEAVTITDHATTVAAFDTCPMP